MDLVVRRSSEYFTSPTYAHPTHDENGEKTREKNKDGGKKNKYLTKH